MILLFAFADPECLYDDYTNNPKMEGKGYGCRSGTYGLYDEKTFGI
ncbi:MAG: hypothetical protein ABIL88_00155 [candidate division WOR-3 bacterium]